MSWSDLFYRENFAASKLRVKVLTMLARFLLLHIDLACNASQPGRLSEMFMNEMLAYLRTEVVDPIQRFPKLHGGNCRVHAAIRGKTF